MKLDAEPPYDNSEHASKVTFDCNKQFPSDTLKLDDRVVKIEQDVVLDAKEGKVFQSIYLSQSCNGSNAYYLSGKSDPINNCKNNSECSAAPCTCEISVIAQEDLFYMDKTVTDVELPHLSVSTKAFPTVKDICIDEGVQTFDKILAEYDKVDQSVFSSSNFPRMKGNSALMEEAREMENLSTNEGLHSLGKLLEVHDGETEFSSPSKCTTDLNETIDKTAKNDLRYFLVTGYPVEQCHSSSSISERRPLDTTEINACTLPSEEIIDLRSHLLEEFKTDFIQVDSSSHNHDTSENQDLRQKLDQVAEKEDDLTTMAAASSAEKAKENKLIAGIVYSNQEEKTSEFVVTSNDAASNRIDNNTNRDSDDPEIDGVASISDLEAKDTSIAGNENKALNNEQSLQSQDVETEEPGSDGTTSARSSFSHITYGDTNLLGPANFSGSITASSHIPYSGNISLRSESSTTSGQSFAFPVLQPEWSSSPVRMAKADRRHLRKHRWKTALTCCKF